MSLIYRKICNRFSKVTLGESRIVTLTNKLKDHNEVNKLRLSIVDQLKLNQEDQ